MSKFIDFLRKRATANGCEVVLPWFPEAKADSKPLELVRKTRREPEGSKLINYPLGLILWMGLSTMVALRIWRKESDQLRRSVGIGKTTQLAQLIHLAWWKNVCPLEYYEFQYFLKKNRDKAELFLPATRQGRISLAMNANRDTERLNNKLNAFRNLTEANLPTPQILEIFYEDGTREFSAESSELDSHIGKDFFVKPVNSYGGNRAARWLHNKSDNSYSDGNQVVEAKELWTTLTKEAKLYSTKTNNNEARLLQELMRNHPVLDKLSRDSLNTVRVLSMMFPGEQHEVMYCVLKMALGDEVQDTKNCVASDVDIASGRLARARSVEPGEDGGLDYHPDTGARIEGVQLPFWQEVLTLVKNAHHQFPDLPIIGWDIAICPEGPKILEANCNPKIGSIQAKSLKPSAESRFADLFWAWNEFNKKNQ